MTHTPLVAPTAPAAALPLSPARRVLRALAVVSCVPYLALKAGWIAGGRLGIPDGSFLLTHADAMVWVNALTVLMDGAVIVLALLLTRAWGRRVPAALLALPMWAATGLLAPIMVAFPLQLLGKVLTGGGPAPTGSAPFLDEWVFGVVYGGFIVQGIALGGLFVPYARERWGHLWQGRITQLGAHRAGLRAGALVSAVLAALTAVPHALRAAGAATAFSLGEGPAGENALSVDVRLVDGVHALFALALAASLLLLALRAGGTLRLRAPLAVAWVGSGVLGCWGGWLLLSAVLGGLDGERPAWALSLTYAVRMIAGLLALGCGSAFFVRRHTAGSV
ncbi:hypothetical protein [Streptomyces sp. NPDC051561]|uniref:hypothetical protein n=1 Tax=Streptomyces sp. NPDC051561 TaxID=3365658 RepID=UPI0037873243